MRVPVIILIFFNYIQTVDSQHLSIVYEEYTTSYVGESYRPGGANTGNHFIAMFTLRINNGISKFSRDSIFLKFESPFHGFSPWTTEFIYKNYNNDEWIKARGIYMEGYAVKKKLSDEQAYRKYYNWRITGKKKFILGIECIQAEANNGHEVWYAPSIPYPDGPEHGVFNLPGLVFEYIMPNRKFTAKSIKFENSEIVIPEFNYVESEESIFIDFGWKNFSRKKSIPLDKDTPLNQWLKFEN